MPTRRDQLQAHRFQQRRAVAALVTGEPDDRAALRGLTAVTLSGIMIATVVAAGFAVLGLVRPVTNDGWRADGAIIVTNETAAIYVRIDGVLHPVLNYASAALAVAGRPRIVHVDRRVLDGAELGSTIGIAGLPTSLPSAGGLATAPFTVCSRTRAGVGTTRTATVSLDIGGHVAATPIAAGTGVVARSAADGAAYLFFGGRRLTIGSAQVATALQLDTSQAGTVGTALLNGVPAGTPVQTPTVAGAGVPYRRPIAGRSVRVGRLLHNADDRRYLLVLPDGVAELTDVQTRLLETVRLPPDNVVAAPVEVSRSAVLALPQSTSAWPVVARQFAGLPASVPRVSTSAGRRGGLCAQYRAGSLTPTLAVPPGLLPDYPPPHVTQSARSARGYADTVTIAGGQAALVRSNEQTTTFLLAEPGRRYPVTSRDVLARFGYGRVRPVRVPARFLALIPLGRALDPVAARTPVPN